MRAIVLLPACLCLIAATAPTSPPVAVEPPAPVEEATAEPVPPHIAALNLPPPAQARGPVEELPGGALGEPAPDLSDGITRCTGTDGSAVFTDRRCDDVGAVPYTAPLTGNATTRVFVRSCAHSRVALLDGLRDALESQDANRVASYFHWTGMGNNAAYGLMDRLQKFSERPLMDIRLVTSVERAAETAPLDWRELLLPSPLDEPPAPRPPNLIRIDQARGYKDAASEVTFLHLLSNAGCWWVQF